VAKLSTEAAHILSAIASGKLLRVARDGSGARLVDPPWSQPSFGQIPVSDRVAYELFSSGALEVLSKKTVRWFGVTDGETASYWVSI
jgi:hypothetical protein